MAMSAVGAAAGWSAVNPVTGETLSVKSLLSEQSLQLLITEIPRTFAAFAPLGCGRSQRPVRCARARKPQRRTEARARARGDVDGHVDLPCRRFRLCRLRAPGRPRLRRRGTAPRPRLIVGFAGVCVGLAGNLLPGVYDVLILGITETGARLIQPGWTMNPVGNWWFGVGIEGQGWRDYTGAAAARTDYF